MAHLAVGNMAGEVYYTNGCTKPWSGPPSTIDDLDYLLEVAKEARREGNRRLESSTNRAIEQRRKLIADRHELCRARVRLAR